MDHLPSWSQQKSRSKTPMPFNMNMKISLKLFFNWLIDSKRKTSNTLKTTSLYLSKEGYYQRLPISDVSSIDRLMLKHEEADFRLMVHAKHAIDSKSPVIIWSHSADKDIFIMALTSFYSTNLILDSGTGAGRNIVRIMPDVEIEEDNRNVLISFLCFTECDYTSSLFCKGKTTSRRAMNSKSHFKEVMIRLGENNSVDDNLCRKLGKFGCTMYGVGYAKDINAIRFNKLSSIWSRIEKISMWACHPCRLAKPL